jgi:hypothetical protein
LERNKIRVLAFIKVNRRTRECGILVMCDKCQERNRRRYLRILERVPDPLLAEGVRKLIEEAEAEKATRHAEQEK